MKNLPLSIQIWLVFAAITLSISILLTLLFPWTLRDFFTKEIYATIESAQTIMLHSFANEVSRERWETAFSSKQLQNIRAVNHFVVMDKNEEIIPSSLPVDFLNKVKMDVQKQKEDSQRYSGEIDDRKIFYVITKGYLWGQDVFLVSYLWDSYREDLVQTLFKRLVFIMSLVFLFSWIPSLALAKYLSNPLVVLEKRVKKLAYSDWHEPIQLLRKDEIGRLGQTIEFLRSQLVRRDEVQQSFLQNVSHELKTPVMIIRSYTQAIKDGIYPKGDLERTVQVIEEEARRLEKCIHNLLYLTKLDYMTSHKLSREIIVFDKLIRDVVERIRWRRSEIDWRLELSPVKIMGDIEKWRVVLENLFDNQVRYANNCIVISLKQLKDKDKDREIIILHVWNDGPGIEPEIVDSIFEKFNKGLKGGFGLGLAIAHRIVFLHNAKIWVKNEDEGVSFFLEIPLTLN